MIQEKFSCRPWWYRPRLFAGGNLGGLAKCTQGNALILVTLALPALIGAGGLAMDTVHWTLTQRQLQREADSAALAGAFAKSQARSPSTAANASITRDNLVALSASPKIENAPTTGPYAGDTKAVRVVLQSTSTLPFSNLFLGRALTIQAEATAAAIPKASYCLISLEETSATGIIITGNATVEMGCGMATNSSGAPAVSAGASSTTIVSQISAVGAIEASASYSSGTVLIPYSAPQSDPYSELPMPVSPGKCSTLLVGPGKSVDVPNASGVTCLSQVDIRGTANFAPGIYYIDRTTFIVGSQAVVTGSNVTFILSSAKANTDPSGIGTLNLNAGATLNLAATTSGTYAGLLFYQDRRAPPGEINTINGNSSSVLQGAFYFPSQDLSFLGTTGMKTDCIRLVSRRVTFSGNSTINNVCPPNSGAGTFVGTRVLLVG